MKKILVILLIAILFACGLLFLISKNNRLSPKLNTYPSPTQSVMKSQPTITPTEDSTQTEVLCNDDRDCKTGETCRVVGPIIAGQKMKKICTAGDQVQPL